MNGYRAAPGFSWVCYIFENHMDDLVLQTPYWSSFEFFYSGFTAFAVPGSTVNCTAILLNSGCTVVLGSTVAVQWPVSLYCFSLAVLLYCCTVDGQQKLRGHGYVWICIVSQFAVCIQTDVLYEPDFGKLAIYSCLYLWVWFSLNPCKDTLAGSTYKQKRKF